MQKWEYMWLYVTKRERRAGLCRKWRTIAGAVIYGSFERSRQRWVGTSHRYSAPS